VSCATGPSLSSPAARAAPGIGAVTCSTVRGTTAVAPSPGLPLPVAGCLTSTGAFSVAAPHCGQNFAPRNAVPLDKRRIGVLDRHERLIRSLTRLDHAPSAGRPQHPVAGRRYCSARQKNHPTAAGSPAEGERFGTRRVTRACRVTRAWDSRVTVRSPMRSPRVRRLVKRKQPRARRWPHAPTVRPQNPMAPPTRRPC